MLIILSPAKTQDFTSPISGLPVTQPRLVSQTLELVKELKKYGPDELSDLMSISDKLAELNFDRYQHFSKTFTSRNARQALLAFKGDVYTDIEVNEYSRADFDFAQHHLRMLSGLYGVLRPLDLMQPYRLEMKTPLKTARGKNLYEFWDDCITNVINNDLKTQGNDVLVNLASQEYYKVLSGGELKARVVTPVFKEQKGSAKPKIIALFAKRARGMMSNFIIRNRLKEPEQLKRFSQTGYRFDPRVSDEDTLVFIRKS